jgi:hypothetical protein
MSTKGDSTKVTRREFTTRSSVGLAGLAIGLGTINQHIDTIEMNDEIAIKEVLVKESATWRSGDKEGHAECWQARPYSKILISKGDGQVLDVPVNAMINPSPNAFGQGGTSENSNYQMSIMGDSAWVSHDEVSYDAAGEATYSSEIRLLEKVDGKWKLVGQSIHQKAKK